jgi:membrane fusion protein (multidrug efflux system)
VTGSVVPFRAVQLASPAEGPVVSLRVRQGDRVRKGDTLLVIGRQEGAEAQITSLLETVRKEEANLARVERLLEIDGNSREQLDKAKAAYELAKAQLVKARESARDYSVIAPWDGMTSRLFVEVGDYNYISPRKPLLELYDPTSLVIRISAPEQYAVHLRQQTPVSVTLDAYPDTVFQASISRIYPYLDERLRTRTIEVTVVGGANLLPGMFARAKLQTGLIDAAIVVPAEAIATTLDAASIAFVVADGKAQRRLVHTGIEDAGRVQIIDGIKPGDSVIVTGVMGLSDGRAVQVIDGMPAGAAVQESPSQQTTKPATATSPDGRK